MFSIKPAALAASGIAFSLFAGNCFAQDGSQSGAWVKTGLGFVLEGAGEFGGDHIVKIYFDDDSDQTVDTGDGVSLAVGGHYRLDPHWDFRGTVGYKYVTTKANNADIYVDRIVWKAAADYFFDAHWHVGGGLVYHSGIKFHGDGIGPNIGFKDATGGVIEAGWSFIGLSYTLMDYKDEFGNKYDANNIGIYLIGRF